MPAASQQVWMSAFAHHLPARRPLSLLDLGSGVGRLTPALAEAFGGPVTGVEPSAKMLAQAMANSAHPDVTYLTGSSESIPLPTATFDAAILFFVWHHVAGKAAAARDLCRVVRPGGRLLVRTNLSDRMPDLWWYRLFPRAFEVDQRIYRPLGQSGRTSRLPGGHGSHLMRWRSRRPQASARTSSVSGPAPFPPLST